MTLNIPVLCSVLRNSFIQIIFFSRFGDFHIRMPFSSSNNFGLSTAEKVDDVQAKQNYPHKLQIRKTVTLS